MQPMDERGFFSHAVGQAHPGQLEKRPQRWRRSLTPLSGGVLAHSRAIPYTLGYL
jgi:hypothetical protein